MSNQEMLDILLPELRDVAQTAQVNSVTLASMGQQLAQLTKVTSRMETAIYGNGKPGLQARVEDQHRRLSGIESTCKLEQEADLIDRLGVIEEQHHAEKTVREKVATDLAEAQKAERSEWRKFRWGFIGTIVTVILDIVLHALHLVG